MNVGLMSDVKDYSVARRIEYPVYCQSKLYCTEIGCKVASLRECRPYEKLAYLVGEHLGLGRCKGAKVGG